MFDRVRNFLWVPETNKNEHKKRNNSKKWKGKEMKENPRVVTISENTLSLLNIISFLVFGMLTFLNMEILFSAAEDILSGYQLPTSTVIICFVLPLVLVKVAFPWMFQKVPYLLHTCAVTVFMILGTLFVVFSDVMSLKLLGISLNAMATGAAEMVFLALTAYYPKVCLSAFVAGTGAAALVAPLYFTAATTWSCISPRTAIMIVTPWPLFFLIFYAALDKEPIRDTPITRGSTTSADDDPNKNVLYQNIHYKDESDSEDETKQAQSHFYRIDCSMMVQVACKLVPLLLPLFLSFFSEYLAVTSVVTTVAFPASGVPPRDHYQYYSLSYRIGKFIGRSYLFFCSFFSSFAADCVSRTYHTWVFAALNILQLVFLLFDSWYRFLPYMWIIIFMCSSIGLFAGLIVSHSPHMVPRIVKPNETEFALSLLSLGNGLGGLTAAVIGLFLEPYLTAHCISHFQHSNYCFTRYRNVTGWETNIHCIDTKYV